MAAKNLENILNQAVNLVVSNLEPINKFKTYDMGKDFQRWGRLYRFINTYLERIDQGITSLESAAIARRIVERTYTYICPKPREGRIEFDEWECQMNLFWIRSEQDVKKFIRYFQYITGVLEMRESVDVVADMKGILARVEYWSSKFKELFEEYEQNEELRSQLCIEAERLVEKAEKGGIF